MKTTTAIIIIGFLLMVVFALCSCTTREVNFRAKKVYQLNSSAYISNIVEIIELDSAYIAGDTVVYHWENNRYLLLQRVK